MFLRFNLIKLRLLKTAFKKLAKKPRFLYNRGFPVSGSKKVEIGLVFTEEFVGWFSTHRLINTRK
ncbi:hypothetical protein THIOSC15_50008 [uncultured Thiomicrorhabdus sp.]